MINQVAASFPGEKFIQPLWKAVKNIPKLPRLWKAGRDLLKQPSLANEKLEGIKVKINDTDRLHTAPTLTATQQPDYTIYKRKLKELREAVLWLEDLNEEYEMSTEQRQQSHHDERYAAIPDAIFDFFNTTKLLIQVLYVIQDIDYTILEIKEKYGLFLSSSTEVASQHRLRKKSLYNKEDEVVGFDVPRAQLMGWLKEDQIINLAVICVVGAPGQGKTTLARTTFDKVVGDFDCYEWITVSQRYTTKEGLLRTMLEKFFKGNKEELDRISELHDKNSLEEEVRNYLQQKRYVIFFDDVWREDFWSQIEFAAVDNEKGSRIVITTRSEKIANFFKGDSIVHILNLRPLSHEHSLELFSKKAFLNTPGKVCPKEFEDISSKIVEKCEGLPLAIVAAGGLLASQELDLFVWEKIYKALIFELEKNHESTGITIIVGLSYDGLSHNSKSCFLYFGIYPEDYEIEPERLIRQWIADGFVKSESHETLEEVAEQYLNDLVQRNLVQASSFRYDCESKMCRVHDLFRDMILKKIKDINFCHFIGNGEDDSSMFTAGKIRRLQITTNSIDHSDIMTKTIEGSLIRSLYVFGEGKLSEDFVKMILTKCKRLKVVDFEGARMRNCQLECLGNLNYLRYLSLRNTDVKYLPMSIGNLSNLETLDLRDTNIKQLPGDINKVKKLRHLLVSWLEIKKGIRSLEFLQTLDHVKVGDNGDDGEGLIIIKELEKLRQLRSLCINIGDKKYVSALCSSINKMQHLEKLGILSEIEDSIDWGNISPPPTLHKLWLVGNLERFQEWILKYQNIASLTLLRSNLTEDPLKSLKNLPNLSYLSLIQAYKGESLHFENGKFQNLKKLELEEMKKLNSIDIGEGALSSLKQLTLFDIPQLKMVPSWMHHLSKLEVFFIRFMPKEFCDSVQQMAWIHQNVGRLDIDWVLDDDESLDF